MAMSSIRNPPMPFNLPILGGMMPGRMIKVRGLTTPGIDRFDVMLICGAAPDSDIGLHLWFRFQDMQLVMNNVMRGTQPGVPEQARLPLQLGQPFELVILCQPQYFYIAVNGQHLTQFAHRIPSQNITNLAATGQVQVQAINFEMQGQGVPAIPPAHLGFSQPHPSFGTPQQILGPPPPGAVGPPPPQAYGPPQPAYGPSQPAYGPSQPAYGPSQPAYGPSQPAYGPSQPAYGPPASQAYAPPPQQQSGKGGLIGGTVGGLAAGAVAGGLTSYLTGGGGHPGQGPSTNATLPPQVPQVPPAINTSTPQAPSQIENQAMPQAPNQMPEQVTPQPPFQTEDQSMPQAPYQTGYEDSADI